MHPLFIRLKLPDMIAMIQLYVIYDILSVIHVKSPSRIKLEQ